MFNQDFKEFLISLNDNNVRYLIVGGYAVAYHGYPRYTKDIDIWISRDLENAQHMVLAMDQFGFSSLGLKVEDFLEENIIIQLGYLPNRIDIITTLPGVEFDACYQEKIETEIEGQIFNFINLEDLKSNKLASGRKQDLADVDQLS